MNLGPWERFAAQFPYLIETLLLGVEMTIIVTLGGFVVAVAMGMLGAVLRTARLMVLRVIGTLYVDVFRAVPVLTQLFIIYFGLAELGLKLDPIPAAIIGFGINGGAYLTEVFRAGIEAVHRGQNEAALSIGMTRAPARRATPALFCFPHCHPESPLVIPGEPLGETRDPDVTSGPGSRLSATLRPG